MGFWGWTIVVIIAIIFIGALISGNEQAKSAEAQRKLLGFSALDTLEHGSPSLLNEAPIYLALHDACVDLGRAAEAKEAIARALPRLVTRVHGLSGTPYAGDFLRHLAPNAGLIAAAAAYGLLPAELAEIVARDG